MTEQHRSLYRQKSLDRLAAPDRLDQLLRIVAPRAWVALLASAVALTLGLVWGIFGTIPVTADGIAMLVRPGQIVAFQSPGTGKVAQVHVRIGDRVAQGDLLGTLRLPELEQQLQQEQLRLEQARERTRDLFAIESELTARELLLLDEQAALIASQIATVEARAGVVKERTLAAIETQRSNIAETRELSGEFLQVLRQRFASYERLFESSESQLVSQDQIVDLQSRLLDRELRAKELGVSLQELDLREIRALEAFDGQQESIREKEISLKDIEIKKATIGKRLQMRALEDEAGLEAIQHEIDRLQARLLEESRMLSEHAGLIVEITCFVGARVETGDRLGKIEIDDPGAEVMAVAYFRIEDGKKLRPGQRMLVSPSTVERERYGGIVGEVVETSEYPVTTLAAATQVGDVEIARTLLDGESRIEVLARLERDAGAPSGFRWSSGDGPEQALLLAGTTARVRVTIESRAPLTFVLPFLKSVAGS